jgi:ribokinase
MPKPLVVVGSLNLDLVLGVERMPQAGETIAGSAIELFCGGKGANQAAAAAKLQADVAMIGKLGRDAYGERIRRELQGCGVQMQYVADVDTPTGTALILREPNGENRIVLSAGANAELKPADLEARRDLLAGAGMILTQLETPIETLLCLLDIAARAGVPVMLDPAPAQALPPEVLHRVAWLTPNETEARLLLSLTGPARSALATGEQAETDDAVQEAQAMTRELLALGPQNVLLKRGACGVSVVTHGGEYGAVPAFPVHALDTTAAGDAFNAGFAVRLVEGRPWQEAARFASAAGALTVCSHGALPALPSLRQVNDFLAIATGARSRVAGRNGG